MWLFCLYVFLLHSFNHFVVNFKLERKQWLQLEDCLKRLIRCCPQSVSQSVSQLLVTSELHFSLFLFRVLTSFNNCIYLIFIPPKKRGYVYRWRWSLVSSQTTLKNINTKTCTNYLHSETDWKLEKMIRIPVNVATVWLLQLREVCCLAAFPTICVPTQSFKERACLETLCLFYHVFWLSSSVVFLCSLLPSHCGEGVTPTRQDVDSL